jgi:hypothetical protein
VTADVPGWPFASKWYQSEFLSVYFRKEEKRGSREKTVLLKTL